jgi:hypothetical protein
VLGFSSHTAYVGIGSAFIAMALFGRKTKKNRNDGNR